VTVKHSRLIQKLQLNKFKLSSLLDITKAINNKLPTDELLEIYRQVVQDELEISKLILFAKATDKWETILKFGHDEDKTDLNPEETFKDIKDITVLNNSSLDEVGGYDVLIPVFHEDSALAYLMIGDLDEEEVAISPTIKHMNFIQTLTNILVVSIENKRLAVENLRQARIKRELELAAEMQAFLVPKVFPNNDKVDMSGLYLPHQEIGGDYYDYIPLGQDKFVFCIADVSGKGIAAAFLMANFQAYLKSLVSSTKNLKVLIRLLNKKVYESSGGERFITFFIGQCDLKNGKMEYVNAGHNPPVFAKNNQFEFLTKGCVGLGMLEDIPTISSGTVDISSGNSLVSFTDGLVEMENESHEEYGSERIGQMLTENKDQSMTEFNEHLFNDFNDFCQQSTPFDDIALLSFKIL